MTDFMITTMAPAKIVEDIKTKIRAFEERYCENPKLIIIDEVYWRFIQKGLCDRIECLSDLFWEQRFNEPETITIQGIEVRKTKRFNVCEVF